jgi:predicted transposase/invertase (TIGR01784 family)
MTYAQKMLDERSAGYRMGHREGLEAGREKGLAEGRTETLTQVVRRMQALGFDDSAIAKATGYPIETIQKIHE